MSKNIAAFFDIDGTIYRDSLLIEHFKMLLKYEYINMMSWESKVKEKFLKWENRTGDYDDYLDEMDFVAKRVMELKGDKVYRYTRDRLKYHKGKGHKVIIISGSPDFLVAKLAEKYGADDYRASIYKVNENGVFTGEVEPMWDEKSKKKAIKDFCKKYEIDLKKSFAYGDTTGDLTMFKAVENAIAINPAKKLFKKIKNNEKLKEKVDRKSVV